MSLAVLTILQSTGTNLVFIATSPRGFSVIFPSTIATVLKMATVKNLSAVTVQKQAM